MTKELISAMGEVRDLNHGHLKEFAVLVKGKLTRTNAPSSADYIDAIYEAAVELSREPEDDSAGG